jgi:hypothetical protein
VHAIGTFLLRKPMRGKDDRSEILFSYIRLDERIPADHPLRLLPTLEGLLQPSQHHATADH